MLFPKSKVPVANIAGEHREEYSRHVSNGFCPLATRRTMGKKDLWQQLCQIYAQPPGLHQREQVYKEKPGQFMGPGVCTGGKYIALVQQVTRRQASHKGQHYRRAKIHKHTEYKAAAKIAQRCKPAR